MQTTAPAPKGATRKSSAPQRRRAAAPALQHPTLLRRLALPELPRGPGRAHAPIIWLFICSHLRGPGRPVVWPSNERISRFTGLSLRAVERGIAYLRDAGIISVSYGMRPSRARCRKVGRLIELNQLVDGLAPVVHFPPPQIMAGIWRCCRAVRSRPAALVAVAVATYVVAAAELGGELTEATPISSPISMIRSLVGATHGRTFNDRLADLERAGLLSRAGEHWRDGMIVQLPKKSASQPLPKLEPGPLQRVEIYAANGNGPTLEEIVALDAEVAAALRWRAAARQ